MRNFILLRCIPCPKLTFVLMPHSAFNTFACFSQFFKVSDALACLGASSRGVIRRLYPCGRFKERIAVSPRRSLQSTAPLTFEALHEQMELTRARSPVFRAFRLSSCVCVCVCVYESVCDREIVTHCLNIATATSFEKFARAKCWRVSAHR